MDKQEAGTSPPGVLDTFAAVAGDGDTVVAVHVVLEPVPVQAPALAVLIQVRDVAVAVRVHHECARSRPRHRP